MSKLIALFKGNDRNSRAMSLNDDGGKRGCNNSYGLRANGFCQGGSEIFQA